MPSSQTFAVLISFWCQVCRTKELKDRKRYSILHKGRKLFKSLPKRRLKKSLNRKLMKNYKYYYQKEKLMRNYEIHTK